MANLKLTLACWDYDRTRPLLDGRVRPEGIDLEWRSGLERLPRPSP
jgi:4,5-dihydroxyphthalate decarboxylase